VHLSSEALAPHVGFHDQSRITGGYRPIKTLSKSHFDHALGQSMMPMNYLKNIEEQHLTFVNGIASWKDA
jgi:hypothetical protein